MKRNMMILVAFALVMFSVGAMAQAATVTTFKLHDRSLIANTEYASDDGCIVTQTTVRWTESVTRSDGTVDVQAPTTMVDVVYSNGCTGEFVTFDGGTPTQTTHIAGDFGTASLSAVVPVASEDGQTASVSLNLVWTANGPLQEAKDKTRTRDGKTITVEKFDFKVRPADISGTALTTLPTVNGPLTLDLAAFSEGGTIGKDVLGDRTVTKK